MKNTLFKNDTLSLTECKDGFWLYDTIRGMNISMRAKTEQEAFIKALEYYQKRLKVVEKDYKVLNDKVSLFVSTVVDDDC